MGKPTIYQRIRQTLGRAFRETGQAMDRVGLKGQQMAVTKRVIGDDPVIYQDHLSRHRQQMPLLRRGKPVVDSDVEFLAPCATLIGSVYVGKGSSIFYKSILRADNCDNAEAFRDESINSTSTSTSTRISYINNTKNIGYHKDATVDIAESDVASPSDCHPDEWDLDPSRFLRNKSHATGGGIFIGEETNIQDGCIIDSRKDHTRIGDGVTVGHLASIHSATVQDHCVIGMGALLQEGVIVEEASFIAAGAMVPKNTTVKAGELWGGNPAKKIRDLTYAERERLKHKSDTGYVGLAVNQKDITEPGEPGENFPDSLAPYLSIGHEDNNNQSINERSNIFVSKVG